MSTIVLTLRAGAWIDGVRKYKVLVDGDEVGTIGPGGRESIDVAPGPHEVLLKIDWAQSEPLRLELGEGETAELFCEPNGNILTVLYFITSVPPGVRSTSGCGRPSSAGPRRSDRHGAAAALVLVVASAPAGAFPGGGRGIVRPRVASSVA